MPTKYPAAHWPAIVLHEESEAIEACLNKELFDYFREMIEAVLKLRRIRHFRVAKPRIIRCDHMEPAGKCRDEVSKLMRGCRESTKQNQFRILRVAGFSIEDRDAVDY